MSGRDDDTLPETRRGAAGPGAANAAAPSATADLGERYRLEQTIGRGGMGEIRLARDTRFERDVAVKLLLSSSRDDVTLGRFFREARVQGVLDHPAVVPVHDLGIDEDGNPYFVMKRLTGTTLADVLAASNAGDGAVAARWPARQLLARLVDVCLAIEFAHTRGVIHRDLKPANIMLGEFGEAYVIDWGLAKIAGEGDQLPLVEPLSGDDLGHTAAGELLGTPGYMSPEQVRGEPVDARADVFALGCVLYEILAGRAALPRGIEALANTLTAEAHRPSARVVTVDPELDELCARATAQDAAERPTARAFADAIQAYLDGDRDLARRRELAEDHARAARRALAGDDDDARATAMNEAGRALALDPSNASAQTVLAHLLLEVPDTIPAEALVAADAERGQIRQAVIRKAGWTYVAAIPALAVLFTMPIHHVWPIAFGMVMAAVTATFAFASARRPLPMMARSFGVIMVLNCMTISTVGLLFGPLLVLPFFLVGSLSGFITQQTHIRPWVITAVHLLPLVGLFALELAGVVPRSFAIEAGGLVITPWALDLSPSTVAIVFGLSFAVQLGSTIDIQGGFRHELERSQNQIHAQTWHLRQLLPNAGADLDGTGRTPKVDATGRVPRA